MSKREPLSIYREGRGEYGTFNSVYNFILTDPFFEMFVNSEIRGLKRKGKLEAWKLKKCLDIENEGLLQHDLECLNIKHIIEFAKLLMKLKEMEKYQHTYEPSEYLKMLKQFLKIEFEDIIDKPSFVSWCNQNPIFNSLPIGSGLHTEYIEIMKRFDVPKQETEEERVAREADEDRQSRAFAERMEKEARERETRERDRMEAEARERERLEEEARERERQSRELADRMEAEERQKFLDKFDPEDIFSEFGGKGKRKRTQRRQKQQRKMKHNQYSSRYKNKSKSKSKSYRRKRLSKKYKKY
jgi:hypothetical protein